ncbi:TetR/AcrR family transcriptional regulator [Rhodococcus tukisamuensis]|uniref:Regulatory protein, tetR family n=1 Tax=Rhodococcus tukisamuensis TaxID=168276 RepID=A0A1G7DNG1_9NOCA|nr:helix-turn-helix domain-containing protein [Rhodococcus tukisamuensis]SDE53032.1 regulatory protein, tetR family [Rhodococcus tukisamuensis]
MPETHSAPATARRLDPAARRAQIIECAAKIFEERPYSDVSTTEIAAAAEVGRPLVNHYFGNKRELYLEVVRRFVFVPAIAIERIP